MASYPWYVTFNGDGLETNGLVDAINTPATYYFFSPLALITRGFLYAKGDVWFNLDSEIIQNVTWTPCCEDCDQ